jgi:twitching motility protein PilT
MARLDNFFEYLKKYNGKEIILQSDSVPAINISGQMKALAKQKLSSNQILLLIKEIASTETLEDLKLKGLTEFIYKSPSGPIKGLISLKDKNLKVSFSFYIEEKSVPSESQEEEPIDLDKEEKEEIIELEEEGESAEFEVEEETAKFEEEKGEGLTQTQMKVPQVDFEVDRPELERFFKILVQMGGSDLHICVGEKPIIRKDGDLIKLDKFDVMSPFDTEKLLLEIAPEKNRQEFKERHDTDFAYEIKGLARFRCNLFMDRKGIGGAFRVIPAKILTAEDLGLSPAIQNLCFLTKGLVLVTGPTGSGKSTTLCAMIDLINRKRNDHIITIEDPIEFVHENKNCLINQREVGVHTDSFAMSLRAALREDPDIVLVGEMRDLETIAIAIETAETGHLVFGTLHTTSAASTVDRIIEQFPADRQAQIRVMLSESLKGVISQNLCKKIGGGRIAAMEVLIVTHSIANLIREGKTFQIPSIMQTGRGLGMVTLNDALIRLVNDKLVEPKEAYLKAIEKQSFAELLRKNGHDVSFLREMEGFVGE